MTSSGEKDRLFASLPRRFHLDPSAYQSLDSRQQSGPPPPLAPKKMGMGLSWFGVANGSRGVPLPAYSLRLVRGRSMIGSEGRCKAWLCGSSQPGKMQKDDRWCRSRVAGVLHHLRRLGDRVVRVSGRSTWTPKLTIKLAADNNRRHHSNGPAIRHTSDYLEKSRPSPPYPPVSERVSLSEQRWVSLGERHRPTVGSLGEICHNVGRNCIR